jgi:hypothetical protein
MRVIELVRALRPGVRVVGGRYESHSRPGSTQELASIYRP